MAFPALLLVQLVGGFRCGGTESPFAPGVLDRIECDISAWKQGETKGAIVLAPNESLVVTDSKFSNGQSFASPPVLSGSLSFGFPPVTPTPDLSLGFQPPMEASVSFTGTWTQSQFGYGAARLTLTRPSNGPCPSPPRVNLAQPITIGPHPVSITATCDKIASLTVLNGATPIEKEEALTCVFDAIAGDGGANDGAIFLGVEASVVVRGIYKSRRRPELTMPQGTLNFAHKDGEILPPAQTIIVTNSGGLPLTWTAGVATTPSGGAWLKVTPASGTLDSLDRTPLELTVDPAGLAPGTYNAKVTVSGNTWNGSKSFNVTFTFTGTPKLTVTPKSLEFFNRVVLPQQTLTVSNEGSAPLIFQATAANDGNWIKLNPASDLVNPGQSREITVYALQSPIGSPPLDVGDYNGQITFAPYPGSPTVFAPVAPIPTLFHVLPAADKLVIWPGSVLPLTKDPLFLNKDYDTFRVDLNCQLGSRKDADLALRLFDEDGVLQASSDFIRITRLEGEVISRRVTIPKFKLVPDAKGKAPGKLILRAVLIDRTLLTPILITSDTDYVYTVAKAELVALEVTQVVQDWRLSVPLIEGKPTLVRAHVLSSGPDRIQVKDALLFGTQGGESLGPGIPPSGPGKVLNARTKAESAAAREDLGSTLNFWLPSDWCKEDLQLRFEAPGVQCKDKFGTANDCAVSVRFQKSPRLQVKFVEVEWNEKVNDKRVFHGPPADELVDEEARKLRSVFPLARFAKERDYVVGPLKLRVDEPPDLETVLSELIEIRRLDNCSEGCGRLYYALIPDMPALDTGGDVGQARQLDLVAAGPAMGFGGDFSVTRHIAGHELGHLLGQEHAIHTDNGTLNDEVRGWCGEVAPKETKNFPWYAILESHTVPTLGPLDPNDTALQSDQLVFGFDSFARRVVTPRKNYELMSYCGTPANRFEWPSKQTYEALATKLGGQAALAVARARPQGPDALQDYLLISGTVDFTRPSAAFRPFVTLYSAGPQVEPMHGDYQLVLLNGAAQELQVIDFAPVVPVQELNPGVANRGSFALAVPASPQIKEALIRHGGTVLASIQASSHAPTVKLLFPNGGENVTADPVEIHWQGADADSDSLLYTIQFSADGGGTWETLALKQPGESHSIRQRYLRGTTQGLIRVIASDGFNTAVDISDAPFTVPNRPPHALINSPSPNYLYTGLQPVILEAAVSDPEDGEIPDDKIEWHSSLDGLLGKGASFQRAATTLSEGTHVITLKTTDGTGLESSSNVSVQVSRAIPDQLSDLSVTPLFPAGLKANAAFTFPVTVANQGPSEATGVTLTTSLPAGVKLVSAQPSQGSVQISGADVTCNLGTLAAGADATVSLTVLAKTAGSLTFHHAATAVETDPDPANNAVDSHIRVAPSNVPFSPLVADYQFLNTLASSVAGAPTLQKAGDNSAFITDLVEGVERTVLRFERGNGVSFPGLSKLVTSNAWSIVVLFRFDSVTGYRRLLDLKNGVGEPGCYVADRQLFFFLFNSVGSAATIEGNTWAQVVVTRATDGTVTGYHDGALRLSFKDDAGVMLPNAADVLRFFRDNGDEESAGAVARIRLYDSVLTATEVAALDRLPVSPGPFTITAARSGDQIILTWPVDAVGFVLQSSANPGSITGWSEVQTTPTSLNGLKSVSVGTQDTTRFFRLFRAP